MSRREPPEFFRPRSHCGRSGFALIASLGVMLLFALIVIAFLSLAVLTSRESGQEQAGEEAKANARLALMIALGQLQRELGPDQRVSAPADILSKEDAPIANPRWTGVWRTTHSDGSPFIERDDLNGGLRDTREEGMEAGKTRLNFLVSGNEGGLRGQEDLLFEPKVVLDGNSVQLVGASSAGGREEDQVIVPKVGLYKGSELTGRYGYWVGDLGIKANLRSPNPYLDSQGVDENLPYLSGVSASGAVIEGESEFAFKLTEEEKEKLLSNRSLDFFGEGAVEWRREHFHDLTTYSKGVLADVREGGLKRNLTIFLNGNGEIEPLESGGEEMAPGLSPDDNLVGYANEEAASQQDGDWSRSRHRATSPKFGLLRDWARLGESISLDSGAVPVRIPESEPDFKIPEALVGSSQNLNPARLTGFDEAGLAPILVEGSMYVTYSIHLNPPGGSLAYNIRSHTFPRVVLWNPYSVPLVLDESMAMIQVNGRRGFRTDAWERTEGGGERFLGYASWLSWGGRNPLVEGEITESSSYNDAYTGSYYFKLPETTFAPGECLVFLPDQAAEYDGENVTNNTLSSTANYDQALNYYQSASEYGGGMNWYPKFFWYAPSNAWFEGEGQTVQGDDSQMILKSLGTRSEVSPEDFDLLKQIAAVSCSLQYGAGKEPVESWSHDFSPDSGVRMEFLDRVDPEISLVPDRRTRQGYRMRWFREHDSHLAIFGNPLADQPEFWDESLIGSWNLRAAYASRSPFDNLAGNVGDGSASGPWFFGIYSKDLYDEVVGWSDQTPLRRDGANLGNPFGIPSEGAKKYILFDVPRKDLGVLSLAQFQHAKVSEFVWHPSYAIGNSLVDPRLGREGMDGTAPKLEGEEAGLGGFSKKAIGWSEDQERGQSEETWAEHGRGYFHNTPEGENLVYDLSYELNHTLWDAYFLSSGSEEQLRRFAEDPINHKLPNTRMESRRGAKEDDLGDFHRAAGSLMVDGSFNVNSTSVEAWKAMLAANRRVDGLTPFPRVLGQDQAEVDGSSAGLNETWAGTRVLRDQELTILAEELVREVRLRGPFLSMADFVNRDLGTDESGRSGAIESAISAAGINRSLNQDSLYRVSNQSSLTDYAHPDHIEDSTRMEQSLKPESKAWGAPAYLTQADVLQAIGSTLSARSDSFVVRAYGESVSKDGVKARAWCEAIVQRVPDSMRPDTTGLNPDLDQELPNFGRKFVIHSFRWLNRHEI